MKNQTVRLNPLSSSIALALGAVGVAPAVAQDSDADEASLMEEDLVQIVQIAASILAQLMSRLTYPLKAGKPTHSCFLTACWLSLPMYCLAGSQSPLSTDTA